MRKTKDVICRKCKLPQRVPINAKLTGGVKLICMRKIDNQTCQGSFKLVR